MKEASVLAQDRQIVDAEHIKTTLNVSQTWLDDRVAAGDIRPLKAGRLSRFYWDEVVAYLERNR
jgi:hypothetical protein